MLRVVVELCEMIENQSKFNSSLGNFSKIKHYCAIMEYNLLNINNRKSYLKLYMVLKILIVFLL